MSDPEELSRILNFWGPENLLKQAAGIQPRYFGSYAGNIAFLAQAHFTSLRWVRNLCGLIGLANAIGSF